MAFPPGRRNNRPDQIGHLDLANVTRTAASWLGRQVRDRMTAKGLSNSFVEVAPVGGGERADLP